VSFGSSKDIPEHSKDYLGLFFRQSVSEDIFMLEINRSSEKHPRNGNKVDNNGDNTNQRTEE
jgi:hypothetical protein